LSHPEWFDLLRTRQSWDGGVGSGWRLNVQWA
jgi:hypothetical protein